MNPSKLFHRSGTQWRSFSKICSLSQSNTPTIQTERKDSKLELQSLPTGAAIQSEPVAVPQPDGEPKKYSTNIEHLVNEITKLNLVEVGELSELLKKRLNLPDVPAIPLGGFSALNALAPAPEAEEEAEVKKVKTNFTVKLMKFDEKQKVALIKEVKNLLEGMNLVQAKKFVESAPTLVKADVSKEEAEKLKVALTQVGAEVAID